MSLQNPLLRKLNSLGPWTNAEAAILESFCQRRRRLDAHHHIIQPRDVPDDAYLVQRGWTCVYKLLPDGGRQVLSFPLPGDIVGLSWLGRDGAPCWFETLTEVEISPISITTLLHGATSEPNIARALHWSIALDSAIAAEHLVNVGRRSALARTAHFLIELAMRLRLISGDMRNAFPCPVNQYWLADALGLTAIHLNRVLRELREAKLVTLRAGQVDIHDFEGLSELAGFDADYLKPPTRLG